jgi:hypothetical protein
MDKQRFILWPNRPDIRQRARVAVEATQAEEKPWEVVIRPYRKDKSQEQLGYLWAGVLPAICKHLEETGLDRGAHYTPDDVYEWMVDEYAEKRVITIDGVPKVANKSASKMNTKQMSDFIDRVIQHAAEKMKCVVPLPDYR